MIEKNIRQLGIILLFSMLGELCSCVSPVRLPAAIYGLILLVAALLLKLVKLEWVRQTGSIFTGLLPMLFMVPVVGLLDHWKSIAPAFWKILIIVVASTCATFAASGLVTQWLMRGRKKHD